MSSFLLKLYGFLTIITLVLAGYLLYGTSNNRNTSKKITLLSKNTPSAINTKIEQVATSSVNSLKGAVSLASKETSKTISGVVNNSTISIENSDYTSGGQQKNPCSSITYYRFGSFDSRFSISKSQFESETSFATNLWNNALGKKIFVYDTTNRPDDIVVNLIYDERQATTDRNKLLGAEIDNTKEATLALEKEYKALQVIFEQKKDIYTSNVEAFNVRQKKYNDDVTMWNDKGGAPRAEFDALTVEKTALQTLAEGLNASHDELDAMLKDINAKIARHNELVAFANQNIDVNNSSANIKFTEGNYNSGTNQINIFQFTDTTKLKRVLAHEFGHAIGLDHVTGKQSIMYSINTATSTVLSPSDIQALQTVCQANP